MDDTQAPGSRAGPPKNAGTDRAARHEQRLHRAIGERASMLTQLVQHLLVLRHDLGRNVQVLLLVKRCQLLVGLGVILHHAVRELAYPGWRLALVDHELAGLHLVHPAARGLRC